MSLLSLLLRDGSLGPSSTWLPIGANVWLWQPTPFLPDDSLGESNERDRRAALADLADHQGHVSQVSAKSASPIRDHIGYEAVPATDAEIASVAFSHLAEVAWTAQPTQLPSAERQTERQIEAPPTGAPGIHAMGALQLWLEQDALAYARTVPVALAFGLPDLIQHTTPVQLPLLPTEPLPIAQPLPPPSLGEMAVVWQDSQWHPLHLDLLKGTDESAGDLQAEIAQRLAALAAPASWYPYSEILSTCLAGEETQRRLELEEALANARGHSHTSLQETLEALASAAEQAESLRQELVRGFEQTELWHTQLIQLRQYARDLAGAYWRYWQQSAQHGNKPVRSLPPIVNIFPDANRAAPIPAVPPVHAVLAAYSNAQSGMDGWFSAEDSQLPTFTLVEESGATSVQVRPDESEIAPSSTLIQSLWDQVVSKFSDRDGDVFLALLAQAMAPNPQDLLGNGTAGDQSLQMMLRQQSGRNSLRGMTTPPADPSRWITAGLILDYRGIRPIMKRDSAEAAPRRHGHRTEDLLEVSQCVARMRNTWVTTNQAVTSIEAAAEESGTRRGRPAQGGQRKQAKRSRKRVTTRESPLILIHEQIRQHEVDGETGQQLPDSPSMPIMWRFEIGSWLKPFLEAPNIQIAWLVQQALAYDPYREVWEKRLARYFLFHLRLHAGGGGSSIAPTIGRLIRSLSLPLDERHPERSRARFEDAMNRLCADSQIDEWFYEPSNPELPARRWLLTWLNDWRVRVSVGSLERLHPSLEDLPALVAPGTPIPRTKAEALRLLREQAQQVKRDTTPGV